MNEHELKIKMEKALTLLEDHLRKLRTGKASVSLIEGIKVDAYGTMMPIEQLSSISLLDYKTILVQPWDKTNVDGCERAINNANLGMRAMKDADVIRVNVPDLTEERRKELTKVVGIYEEEAKVALRQTRKEFIESFKNDKEATEDDVRMITEEADKLIKEFNEKVAGVSDKKRAEMMEI